ncbi:(2E,6E)-farnesyl diphosphate synthase [Cellvibrio japonicus]|uniref:Geranyltranstransferase n=1 Tax=Cellvibrio japonicus (strain Ueda107) TaxID=498211 RepID=B3PF21_CELJU|nr:farnesyl diphosphate synthase [Cellvibrio japonicus]ACE86039.1 geranyltranstransferase [Cellvibrio japonicus Ueda107]QEI13580.1 (2E,6E)-farnesyl diphosphate synthase [Cellvibrio japonicus]QEI17154.1 (2E,6E)-farnesyl diphosphate synthase [Cellvibrio japonicus]QEI20731.1 (2E,6E)-farnesyl diphosphate synthase [Cellvibrio japonicus]
MTWTFRDFASHCRQQVDTALDQRFPLGDDPTQLRAAMRYSLFNGGKRVRPILAYASALAINPHISLKQVDPIAAAVECLHAYSLVHDDLPAMDDDDLRRGKPTCHIAFNEATAILAGDGLQTLAFELLGSIEAPADIRIQLIQVLAKGSGVEGMVLGQAIDLAAVEQQLTLEQLETMHRYKTGALIRASVTMGALFAGANNTQLAALDQYASAIGLAFQVQDDILDVISDTQTLGKQQGADIARNKPTYVSLLGLDAARTKADDLYRQAQKALDGFGSSADPLRQLASYIVERTH